MKNENTYEPRDGFVRLENNFLEALAKFRLPGEAVQVLMVLIRFTLGYNRIRSEIARSQIMERTGMPKRSVERAIKRLIDMNLINRCFSEGMRSTSYAVNLDSRSWIPTAKRRGGASMRQEGPQKSGPTLPQKSGPLETMIDTNKNKPTSFNSQSRMSQRKKTLLALEASK